MICLKYYKSENHIPQNIKRVFCKWALKKDLEDVFARIDDIQILNMFHNFRLEKKYIPYFEDKFLNLLKKKRKKPMINDQYIIALTCLKNHKATKKYLHTIIRRKNYSLKLITADRVFEPVMSFIDHVKYLKYLNKVFKVSCKKTFVDNSMMSIKQDLAHVWMKIGVRSPGNFKRVRKNLKKLKRYHPFFINNILIEIEKAFLKQEFIFIPIKEAISVSKSIIHGK